jgi:hypothetical protein
MKTTGSEVGIKSTPEAAQTEVTRTVKVTPEIEK